MSGRSKNKHRNQRRRNKTRPTSKQKSVVELTFNIDELLKNNRKNSNFKLNDLGTASVSKQDEPHPGIDSAYIESMDFPGRIAKESAVAEPFDASKIRVSYKEFPIDLVLRRIQRNELQLDPEFQRFANIWNVDAQSRLIESVLIRIPLPVFYIDSSEEDRWVIIDGLQRLNAFKRFALDNTLKLDNLEFLKDLHGLTFGTMPKNLQRRFLESTIGMYLIERGTPDRLKFSIFQRINTGGLPLSGQEIRHAIYQGAGSRFLAEIAGSQEFKSVTSDGISKGRMADREIVLRALAFMLNNYRTYQQRDLDGFLNKAMLQLQESSEEKLEHLEQRIKSALVVSEQLFGKFAFRGISKNEKRGKIIKSLFDVWVASIDQLSDGQRSRLLKRSKVLNSAYRKLLTTNKDFKQAISNATGDVKSVQVRFSMIETLLRELTND